MMILCKRKWLLFVLFVCAFFYVPAGFAQITIRSVDPGPFSPGSTVGVPIGLGSACIAQNNRFGLYLSDQNGDFTAEKLIGTYDSFYTSYVNGVIPDGTAAGTGYRLRVKASNPSLVSAPSTAFEIRAGLPVEAKLTSNLLNPRNSETFGTCNTRDNNTLFLNNESTTNSTVTAIVTNELSGGNTNINFDTSIKSFTARLAHYTILTKAVMADGRVATKAYLIVNNSAITAFGTSGNNVVCLPLGQLTFNVDISSAAGIQNNFPGDLYTITWGDQSTSVYSLCDILSNGGKVSHAYTRSSCGSVSVGSSGTIYNAFPVTINLTNSFCGTIGTPVSSSAKVVVKPENSFSFNSPGCTNTNITFTNNSVLGQDPNTNTAECAPNNVSYNWFVDGQIAAANKPLSFNLVTKFSTPGTHTIRLESASSGACNADPIEREICIQNPPQPAFILPATTVCAGSNIKVSDQSVIDNTCNAANAYLWTVSPAVGFANGTTASSKEPEFIFSNPGTYTITLSISTPSCGQIISAPQTVIVNALPKAQLSADILLCNLSVYDFSPTTSGPTKTTTSGTTVATSTTYLWTVTGGSYTFAGGTTAASQYPSIKFDDYASYTVTLTHTNNCGTVTDSQVITFSTAPVVNAGPDQSICFNDSGFTLSGSVTGNTLTQQWVGGAGNFNPNRNALNAVYTPTAAEKSSGLVVLQLKTTTALAAPCNEVTDEVSLRIKEDISITSAASKSICTGQSVAYTPATNVTGVTYNWTATASSGISGYSASGSGSINDVLTNADANLSGTVTYVIIPDKAGCQGTPFNFTVTVNPNPVATVTAPQTTICNRTATSISIASNISGTRYTYTSVVNGAISGNTNRSLASTDAKINDILINTGNTSGTVTYTITPVSSGNCAGSPVSITITVLPSVTPANAGPDDAICNTGNYTLKGNVPSVGSGRWTIVSPASTVTFADATQANTTISGLISGNTYILKWTISDASCAVSEDEVQITVNPPTVAGTTGTDLTLCGGNNSGQITLNGQTGNIIRWEQSMDNGLNWAAINNTNNPYTFNNLTVTTKFRAIVRSGTCTELPSTVTTVTITPPTVIANAGTDQVLCSGSSVELIGNNPAPNAGLWSLVSGQAGITISNPGANQTIATGLVAGQTYVFRWTIAGSGSCPSSSDETTVTYYLPLVNNISVDPAPICAGQRIRISGNLPEGGNGTYTYQWQNSSDGSNWSNIVGATSQDLAQTPGSSTYYRRVVNSNVCTAISNPVQVNVLPVLSNNTVTSDQTLCSGGAITPLSGTLPAGGNGTYQYQWQSSSDGSIWNNISGANNQDYTPLNLSESLYFRRMVSSGPCSGLLSNVVKITINPPAKAEINFSQDKGCVPFRLTATNIKAVAYAGRNATYTWFADQVQIGTGISFPGYTITGENQSIVIKLVVTSSLGCKSDETEHTFFTQADVQAAFSPSVTQGCGPLAVTFSNLTKGQNVTTYQWDFGNGTTSNLAQPPAVTYQPDPSGKDTTYKVTLTASTPCGISRVSSAILVKAKAVSVFSPDKTAGCSPFTITFSNTSPGSSGTYTYDFGDGSPVVVKTDKSNVTHTYTTLSVQNYTVKMTAENECGSSTSQYNINVSPNTITPAMVVNSDQLRGCAPFKVDFYNNTRGANSFVYDFGDGSTSITNSAPEIVSHVFTKPGKYKITLYATNGCSNTSTTAEIEVLDQPSVNFTADRLSGCDGVTIAFKNNSKNAIGYVWDFGDGTTSNQFEPTHVYTGIGKTFSVSLTATNTLGCKNTVVFSNLISIVPPPTAAFTVSPGNEIAEPRHTFNFKDASTGATSWEWTFGDGTRSTLQHPDHTYTESGAYTVTLKILNKEGCAASTFQMVRIINIPGMLSLPNSFMPGSAKTELQTFMAKGKGIGQWKLSVYNKWGQVIWETDKLNDGAPMEGWDGTYKGQEQPQGIYYWKAEVKFINGSEWKGMTYDSSPPKKTGVIHLIR